MFLFLVPGVSPIMVGVGSAIVGLGMGFLSTAAMVIIQSSVGWAERGSATASNVFSRNLGSTLGAAILGGVLNFSLARQGAGIDSDRIRGLLENVGGLGDSLVRAGLSQALHVTFWAVFAVAVVTLLLALLVPSVPLVQQVGGWGSGRVRQGRPGRCPGPRQGPGPWNPIV